MFIYILSILALSFFIRNISGPYNSFGYLRNKIMTTPYIGTFFFKLLECDWCLGFHCGYIIYILSHSSFSFSDIVLWALAGSSIVALGTSAINVMNRYFSGED